MKKKPGKAKRPARPSTRKVDAGPKLLFVVDPWETLDHERDTTLRLIEEALLAGARCAVTESRSIGLDEGIPSAEITRVNAIARPRISANIDREAPRWEAISGYDHVFYRADPPVDLSYLLPLQILATARAPGETRPEIHSPPETLFFLNEKWAISELRGLFPKSLVSASIDRLADFAARTGKVVLKPLYLAQSKGVEVIDTRTFSASTVRDRFRLATESERLPVIVQEFLPGIAGGETRLWFSDGRLIAAVRKVPRAGEAIIDMDRGGSLAPARLTAADRAAAKKIGAFLRRRRILFAAVDLIDGKVTDFNHTSPGLLVAMEELLGENLARRALRPVLGK